MIFWAVTLIVSIHYMLLVLRADNNGEGGILALLALVDIRGGIDGPALEVDVDRPPGNGREGLLGDPH